jgi:hypothetical protein
MYNICDKQVCIRVGALYSTCLEYERSIIITKLVSERMDSAFIDVDSSNMLTILEKSVENVLFNDMASFSLSTNQSLRYVIIDVCQ